MSLFTRGIAVRGGVGGRGITEPTSDGSHFSRTGPAHDSPSDYHSIGTGRTVGGTSHDSHGNLVIPPKGSSARRTEPQRNPGIDTHPGEPSKPVEQSDHRPTNEQFFQSLRDTFARNHTGTPTDDITGRLKDALTGASRGRDFDRLRAALSGGLSGDAVNRFTRGIKDQLVGQGVTGEVSPDLQAGIDAFSRATTGALFGDLFSSIGHGDEVTRRFSELTTGLVREGGYSEDQVASVMQNTLRALLGK